MDLLVSLVRNDMFEIRKVKEHVSLFSFEKCENCFRPK